MKASVFLGRVVAVDGASANVTLTNRATGERVESRCDASVLKAKGIRAGDEFECTVMRHGESSSTQFVRLPPKPARRQSFENRWRL